jgi:type I restriction enzyme M protein
MTRRNRVNPAATEVDAYIFIKRALGLLGWDTRNPERNPAGQVYSQNECLSHPEIKRCLGLNRPENIVKVSETYLWVIEAKRTHGQIEIALSEAADYAAKLNSSKTFKAPLISGVAGNDDDGYLIRTRLLVKGAYVPVSLNDIEMTGLLSPEQSGQFIKLGIPNIGNPPIDDRLFIARAEQINQILHLGAVNPHQRAAVMAALLLSKLSTTGPNIEEKSPTILIEDINARVRDILTKQGKRAFEQYIRIALPLASDNHVKFRQALIKTIQELDLLNIRSAMNSGADWLGAFYEVFLKYASWAQDLGIVLTPRHLTRFVADVMSIRPNDIIYDPTCGTGGFLVAAFDLVKERANESQLSNFKKNAVFGIEQDSGIAALAVVNMIFRGDGKNNIDEGNCFAKFLKRSSNGGFPTAKYTSAQSDDPPVTKVLMNPPFALKRGSDKEYRFIDHALNQMEDNGLLFSVLPYSAMVRPGSYLSWRKRQLLPANTLIAVITFPPDLFYPVGVTSLGIFVKKGIPHPKSANVLWVRALNDGLLKSKGKRLPNAKAKNDLLAIIDILRAFLDNQTHKVKSVNQFQKACPIDFSDSSLELVPEAYLDQAEPNHDDVAEGLEKAVREMLAFLIKINRISLKPEMLRPSKPRSFLRPFGWKSFMADELFRLDRGHFHAIANLDVGKHPTISRVGTDNGLVGFFDKPERARIFERGVISVSSVTGDAFLQPVPFIATDNVVLCTPHGAHENLSMASRFFVQFMINQIKWRYSYGRQCYKTKFAKTQIILPVSKSGLLDVSYMEQQVQETTYWRFVESVFQK